jgi:hypothetical protein
MQLTRRTVQEPALQLRATTTYVRVHGTVGSEILSWSPCQTALGGVLSTDAGRQKPLVFQACTGHGGREAGWRRGPWIISARIGGFQTAARP